MHGAWHGAWCWHGVVEELTARDVPVVAVDLPLTGLEDDVAAARAAIAASGPGTVVVGHSYGGEVISAAARGMPEVAHLIYLCALMPDAGEDVGALMAEHGSEILGAMVADGEKLVIDPTRAGELLYADSDATVVASILPRLRPMAFSAPGADKPAWHDIPSTYVICTADRAIPPSLQRHFAARAGSAVEWPTDHSPFLTRPADVAALIASRLPDRA